jgi:Tol biopolymer transport system component
MNVFGEGDKTHWRKLIDDRTAVNYPAWSPDSTEIAVNKIEKGTEAIYKVDIDGSNETRLDTGFLPTWSPNGHHIAYTTSSDTENPGNLYMMNPDGSDPTLLVSSD